MGQFSVAISTRNSGWHKNITTAKNENLIGIKDGVAVLVSLHANRVSSYYFFKPQLTQEKSFPSSPMIKRRCICCIFILKFISIDNNPSSLRPAASARVERNGGDWMQNVPNFLPGETHC